MFFRNIHVLVGVLEDADGNLLVARRPHGKSLAGAWEFPGGKLKNGESRFGALKRELNEELGIEVEAARPLIRYRHVYPELAIDLDVWRVSRWHGEPKGCEGQALAWCPLDGLIELGLLPADATIVNALRLPSLMLVTPAAAPEGENAFLGALETWGDVCSWDLPGAAPLICLRRPGLEFGALLELATAAADRLVNKGVRLVLHGDPTEVGSVLREPPQNLGKRNGDSVAGLHIPGRFLSSLSYRPVGKSMWFGVSCHGVDELRAACEVGADYAFLGNVLATSSHPGQPGMGWEKFAELVRDLPLPVYAIGGLGPEDLETAWAHGAQGIAAIRSLWPKD